MDIFSALEALRNASPEALQNHRHETIEALREIEARLRELDSPDSDPSVRAVAAVANGSDDREGVSEIVSTQLPSPTEQPTSAGQAKIKQSPTILLTALHTISSWVWKYANLPASKVIQIKRPRIYDRRLNDIRRIEGDPKAGPKYKILRVLAQRSLVLQGEKSGYLDIESYCKMASSRESDKANGGRRGKIASYVRAELDAEDEDKGFAIRAIQAGIKQLVTERLLKKRLEEMGRCESASGISAFTALLIRPFRSLKYADIPEFLDGFLETDLMNFPPFEENGKTETFLPVSTTEVIRVSSTWFDKLQTSYNMFLRVREDFNQHQPNKRKHTRPNHSPYDHADSSTESPPLSDRLGTMESSSSNTGENGSIHYRPTSPQESPASLNEMLEHPQSNSSGSPCSTSPETPQLIGCGLDDQNHTRHCDPSSQQRRHLNPSYTTSLSRLRRSPGSPLYNRGSRSNIVNAMSEFILSDPQHGPSIQPSFDANNTQVPFDPWQNAQVTPQAHGPSIQPYFDANNTQVPFDPWQNAQVTPQAHGPSIQPYFDANNTRVPFDPWQNANATTQLNDPALATYASTDGTQIPLHSSQPMPYQVGQEPLRTALPLYRNMAAQRDHTPVRLALQAAW
ncbi:hypothetical protein N7492_006412 [Penicillium capsulatum]|uniref:Uncharacterized protein n=1 Tax=Penicillium capsulatum TaxID=69766 RepID=A0A9W9I2S7_9EURO|nr:hypothetical protein N7492_006412 [Penicillium capsulatum]KAJ6116251.1 hypothetical protein N7512_005976 [Penicillium capsulatum]